MHDLQCRGGGMCKLLDMCAGEMTLQLLMTLLLEALQLKAE